MCRKLQCSCECPLALPTKLNMLGMVKNRIIILELYYNNRILVYFYLWLNSFYYSVRTLRYFLREVFPSYVSSLIFEKIIYWVKQLVNSFSGIFKSWRVNSEKMANIWNYLVTPPPPIFRPIPPLIYTPHLHYLFKHSLPIIGILKVIYLPLWCIFKYEQKWCLWKAWKNGFLSKNISNTYVIQVLENF